MMVVSFLVIGLICRLKIGRRILHLGKYLIQCDYRTDVRLFIYLYALGIYLKGSKPFAEILVQFTNFLAHAMISSDLQNIALVNWSSRSGFEQRGT